MAHGVKFNTIVNVRILIFFLSDANNCFFPVSDTCPSNFRMLSNTSNDGYCVYFSYTNELTLENARRDCESKNSVLMSKTLQTFGSSYLLSFLEEKGKSIS